MEIWLPKSVEWLNQIQQPENRFGFNDRKKAPKIEHWKLVVEGGSI